MTWECCTKVALKCSLNSNCWSMQIFIDIHTQFVWPENSSSHSGQISSIPYRGSTLHVQNTDVHITVKIHSETQQNVIMINWITEVTRNNTDIYIKESLQQTFIIPESNLNATLSSFHTKSVGHTYLFAAKKWLWTLLHICNLPFIWKI